MDFQKAFDSVWREGLWHVMEHLGYEKKDHSIIASTLQGDRQHSKMWTTVSRIGSRQWSKCCKAEGEWEEEVFNV